MDNINPNLFNTNEIKEAIEKSQPIYIVPTEEDFDIAKKHGKAVTTCKGGIENWNLSCSEQLKGGIVHLFFTEDESVRKLVKNIALSLENHNIAKEINALLVSWEKTLRDFLIKNDEIELGKLIDLSKPWNEWKELTDIDEEDDSSNNVKNEDKKPDEKLLDLIKNKPIFHDQFRKSYIQWDNKSIPIRSKDFERKISLEFYNKYHQIPSSEVLKKVVRLVDAQGLFEGAEINLNIRVTKYNNEIYYDLSNENTEVIIINERGWAVSDECQILFKNLNIQNPQVTPLSGQKINLLNKYIRIKKEQYILFLSWLVSCFIPDIPHPIPNFHGCQGAAKSTSTRIIKKIVDPAGVELLIFPNDIKELIQQLSHQYLCCYDNLNKFPEWVSDVFCRTVTGEGFTKRELYSDDDDIVYSFRRCLCLNGINIPAYKADLLDRSILFELERIPDCDRKEETIFWEEFQKDLPYILGSIFDILSKAISLYHKIHLSELFRMADFTKWGAAIAEAIIPGGSMDFIEEYRENINCQNEEAIQSDPLIIAILKLMDEREDFSGSVTELLNKLEAIALKLKIDTKSLQWPKGIRQLGKKLEEIKATIAYKGLILEHKRKSGYKEVNIRKANNPDENILNKENHCTEYTVEQMLGIGEFEDLE